MDDICANNLQQQDSKISQFAQEQESEKRDMKRAAGAPTRCTVVGHSARTCDKDQMWSLRG
jgi:hypothetical protein